MRGLLLITVFTVACYPAVAFAESDTIVVTADRVPTPIKKLPASTTIIDRKTIETRGYVTLVDALASVPGLRVVQSGGAGSVASVFIRGSNSNQVLVLRDGVPVNDPGDPGGLFNFGVDTLGDVERIEIVRGPMSSVYGSGAIGGVINLISRQSRDGLHGGTTLAAGLPRALRAEGDLSGRFGIWDFSASGESNSDRGSDQTPHRETAVYTGKPDGFRNAAGQVELGVTPISGTRFSLQLRGREAKYGYDTYQFDGGNATGEDNSLFGRVGVASKLADGKVDTNLFVSRLQTDRRYNVTLNAADPNQSAEDDRYGGRRNDLSSTTIWHAGDIGPLVNSSATFGYEHINDQSRTTIDSTSPYSPYLSRAVAHSDSDALSLGLATTVLQRLTTTAQLRQDWTTLAGATTTWRAGVVLGLPEIASRVRVSYGTGFRAPALFDRYGVDSYGYVGNPYLKPERSEGGDIGIEHDIAIGTKPDAAHISATYFNNRTRDLISFVYSPINTSVNIGSARAEGVETELMLPLAPGMSFDFTYTFTDAQNLHTHSALLRRPRHMGSAALELSPIPSVTIAPILRYVGAFDDYLSDSTGTSAYSPGKSPEGVVLDMTVTWKFQPGASVFVAAKNLGNTAFEPVNGYQMPGISFLAGVRAGF